MFFYLRYRIFRLFEWKFKIWFGVEFFLLIYKVKNGGYVFVVLLVVFIVLWDGFLIIDVFEVIKLVIIYIKGRYFCRFLVVFVRFLYIVKVFLLIIGKFVIDYFKKWVCLEKFKLD